MKILASTCFFSEESKPRRHPLFQDLVRRHNFVVSTGTLADTYRGIIRLRRSHPLKAVGLELWLAEANERWPVLVGREREFLRVEAEMLECVPLKNIWMPQPRSTRPGFGHQVSIAATAIAYDLPIASYGVDTYAIIDSHFQLPGLIDAKTGNWVTGSKRRAA
ncbi:hypothetical protein AAIH70_14360 [Neorhizobium sp. BT27B]|uniref:hypothetical protein n=1 Tax=Neorhizobium sp. BT27B TaxID=3142625 RepID=UPI003D2AEAF5